jgi:deoxyxylulose-5-phosphate synthase
VDRAGVVGSDGPRITVVFDSDFLMNIPGQRLDPRNGNELQGMLLEAAARTAGPFYSYPKPERRRNADGFS